MKISIKNNWVVLKSLGNIIPYLDKTVKEKQS